MNKADLFEQAKEKYREAFGLYIDSPEMDANRREIQDLCNRGGFTYREVGFEVSQEFMPSLIKPHTK